MYSKLFLILISSIILIGCKKINEGNNNYKDTINTKEENSFDTLIAVLSPKSGSSVKGIVTFIKVSDGIKVIAEIEGLTPGQHGFHIHEFGDCSDPEGKSAGEHFNPEKMPHSGHDSEKRHVGDFGNILADNSGKAKFELIDKKISFEGTNSIIGKSVIVHVNPDDLTTQPSGNSGKRLACGLITK